jgi:WD40 repeat protein
MSASDLAIRRLGLSRVLSCALVYLLLGGNLFAAEEPSTKWAIKLTEEGRIAAVAFAPDGKSLVSGGNGIKKWDLTTSKQVEGGDWDSKFLNVKQLIFSPDGKCVVSSFNDELKTWDASGKFLRELKTNLKIGTERVQAGGEAPRFSADGKILATAYQSVVMLWNLDTGQLTAKHELKFNITALAFSADSKIIGAASETEHHAATAAWKGYVTLVDINANKELFKLPCGKAKRPALVALSPRADLLAAGTDDGSVLIWDVASGKQLHNLKAHTQAVSALVFSADGSLLSTSDMGSLVCVWDAKAGKEVYKFKGQDKPVRALAFTTDSSSLASGSSDGTVLVWKLQAEK